MQDIKPDTSLYTDLPNKLRAMALILEVPNKERQFLYTSGWGETSAQDKTAVGCLSEGSDYRIKPNPRELWVMFDEGGKRVSTFSEEVIPYPCHTIVRFVEQLE